MIFNMAGGAAASKITAPTQTSADGYSLQSGSNSVTVESFPLVMYLCTNSSHRPWAFFVDETGAVTKYAASWMTDANTSINNVDVEAKTMNVVSFTTTYMNILYFS